jgi:TonB family protein
LHALLLVGVLVLPARLAKNREDPERIDIVFYSPADRVREVPPPTPRPQPLPEPKKVVEVQQPEPAPAPPKPRVVRNEPPPRVHVPDPPRPKLVQRESPKPTVQTDVFKETRPAPVETPPERVARRGGFTDDAAAPSDPNRPARAVSTTAGFATADAEPAPSGQPTRVVADGSFSKGAMSVPREGPTSRRGSVTDTAFTDTAAKDSPSPPRSAGSVIDIAFDSPAAADSTGHTAQGAVQAGAFEDEVVAEKKPLRRSRPVENLDAPVEIVSKPKPVYTDEARRLRIEGEVVLEVTFVASGRLSVRRVLGSLGHGLDEAAVEAAKQIRFTPAQRGGRPVDHTATLRVVFRLA